MGDAGRVGKAGEMLAASGFGRHDATGLDDFDISKSQSSRWQKVARVPAKVVDEHAARCDLNDDG